MPWQISAEQVATIARQAYAGSARPSEPVLLQPPIDDLPRQQNPLIIIFAIASNLLAFSGDNLLINRLRVHPDKPLLHANREFYFLSRA